MMVNESLLIVLGLSFVTAWVPPSPTSKNQFLLHSTASPSAKASETSKEEFEYKLNPLLKEIKPSKTVEIFSLVKSMQAAGEEVTSLCVGEPDFPPSKVVLDATVRAVEVDGDTRYTAVTGTAALRNAIAKDLERRKNVKYNPNTEIVVGNGAKQCVFQAIWACVGAGDEVLVPAPYWPSYPEEVLLTGAKPIIVETTADSGYLLTPDQLRKALTDNPNVSLMILCNPSNPTGGVYEQEQLEALCKVLQEFPHVRVLADEIYERLTYDDIKSCPSVAAMPNMFHRTLTINGFSKAYAMTGYRLGYVAAPQPYAKAISTIQSQLTSCAGSISQAAGVVALEKVTDEELMENIKIMQEKRDYVLGQLKTMQGVNVAIPPKGAFYVLPDVSDFCTSQYDDADLCIDLLQSKKLALVPGSSFGAPGTVRLSYATSMDELETAMNKMRSFFEEKRREK